MQTTVRTVSRLNEWILLCHVEDQIEFGIWLHILNLLQSLKNSGKEKPIRGGNAWEGENPERIAVTFPLL